MRRFAFLTSICIAAVAAVAAVVVCRDAAAAPEGPLVSYGDPVPRDVREMYDAGLRYLLKTQDPSGGWPGQFTGAGVDGMGLMVLLASGEDPNYGPYRGAVRAALRAIIRSQNADTGFFGGGETHASMYQHGFAMLALAEAYGAVDDRDLLEGARPSGASGAVRSIGAALELAVRCAVTSGKKNPLGAWRYGPDATDADTSVAGAVMMGLLAARNAGIEVPDETIDRAIKYFVSMTGPNGQLGYSGSAGSGSEAVTSIGALVYSIARRRNLPQYALAVQQVKKGGGSRGHSPPAYTWYYRAQALFQADAEEWEAWNAKLLKELKAAQAKDGSFSGLAKLGGYGPQVDTPLCLLALAVNYKFLPVYER